MATLEQIRAMKRQGTTLTSHNKIQNSQERKAFQDRLKELMDENKISAQKLAKRITASRQAVLYWKNGKSTPTIYYFKKMAEVFNVSTDYLYGTINNRKNNYPINELKLEDEVIDKIKKWAQEKDESSFSLTDIFNDFMKSEHSDDFLNSLLQFFKAYIKHKNNNDLIGETDKVSRSIFYDYHKFKAIEAIENYLNGTKEDYYANYQHIDTEGEKLE